MLLEFLNTAMLGAGLSSKTLPGGKPVASVRMNGRFAFAEFRCPEEATNAMALNGWRSLEMLFSFSYLVPTQARPTVRPSQRLEEPQTLRLQELCGKATVTMEQPVHMHQILQR